MNILKNFYIKFTVVILLYLSILLIFAPIIDHSFTTLEEDIKLHENNWQILGEIILQLIIVCFMWLTINDYMDIFITKYLGAEIKAPTKMAISIVSSTALVGLQKNLIDKVNYITHKHPFRLTDIYIF